MAQKIQFNRYLLINGSVISWNGVSDLFVQSFFDENGQVLEWAMFKQKYMKPENFYFKWRQILSAIPRDWKEKINTCAPGTCTVISVPHVQVISRRLDLSRLSGKEIYFLLVNKKWEKPTSEEKIEQVLGLVGVDWSRIYMLGRKITIDNYSRQFYFKLTHNILYLNRALNRMNLVESSLCSFCNNAEETPIHLFAECDYVVRLWSQIQDFFRSCLNLEDLTPQSAILGWYQDGELKILKNQILLIFKMVLYKDRELKYCGLERFLNKLRSIKIIEQVISSNREYNISKWNPIRMLLD